MYLLRSVCLALFTLLLVAQNAAATLIQVNASDSGFYNQSGNHIPTNETYITGLLAGNQDRSFLVFDLSSVLGIITGATLHLYNPGNLGICCNGYASPDATENLQLFDVSTPIPTLLAGGAGHTAIYDDLGSGNVYGQIEMSAADNDSIVQIKLNAAALAALNAAAGHTFALGGGLASIEGTANQYVFGFSTDAFALQDVRRLDLTLVQTVSEPSPLALLLVCLGGVGVSYLLSCFRRSGTLFAPS
jgi:hypothetical protein